MSTIPTRPESLVTGRCRKWPRVMIIAASRMLAVVLMMVGSGVIRSWIRTSFGSFPSATAWAISASVMMPTGWPVLASRTTKAVLPACFIRYAAAAAWSVSSTVVSGGRMRSAMVAGLGGGWAACPAEASVTSYSLGDLAHVVSFAHLVDHLVMVGRVLALNRDAGCPPFEGMSALGGVIGLYPGYIRRFPERRETGSKNAPECRAAL